MRADSYKSGATTPKEKAPPTSASGAFDSTAIRRSGLRRVVDALDRSVQALVELVIALLRAQAFGERTREARDHAVLAGQALVGLVTRVTARQRHHLQHARVLHEIGVQVVHIGNR